MKWYDLARILLVLATIKYGNLSTTFKDDNYCMAEDTNPYVYMGATTAYEMVRGHHYTTKDLNNSCRAVKLWSLHRHGAKIPRLSNLQDFGLLPSLKQHIVKNHESHKRGNLCQSDLNFLKSWEWSESHEQKHNALSEEGWREMQTIGKRYKKRLPELFQQKYNETKFYFRYTARERAEKSCKAFIRGIFGDDEHGVRTANPIVNDPVMSPYKNCPSWRAEIHQHESVKFQSTPTFEQMVVNISLRLGFKRPLSVKLVNLMYDICRFEKAWKPKETSAWCVAFTEPHLRIMEYLDDLEHYYKSGHGNTLSASVGYLPIKDMMQKFLAHVEGTDRIQDVTSYFCHDTILLMMMSALGLGQDNLVLTADHYASMKDRNWRTSMFSPCAANFAAVLFDCRDDQERYRVQLHLNEKPLNLCSDGTSLDSQGWCRWSEFYERLSYTLQRDHSFCDDPSLALKRDTSPIFFNFSPDS